MLNTKWTAGIWGAFYLVFSLKGASPHQRYATVCGESGKCPFQEFHTAHGPANLNHWSGQSQPSPMVRPIPCPFHNSIGPSCRANWPFSGPQWPFKRGRGKWQSQTGGLRYGFHKNAAAPQNGNAQTQFMFRTKVNLEPEMLSLLRTRVEKLKWTSNGKISKVKAVRKRVRGDPKPGALARATGNSPAVPRSTVGFSRFEVHFSFTFFGC